MNEIGRQRRQFVILAFRPAILDRHVLTVDVASLLQALAERLDERGISVWRCAVEKPDHRHRALLRARRERPPDGCAAQECDEVTPSHAKLLVTRKAYQRAAPCVTANWAVNLIGKNFLDVDAALVGCGHVSGLFVRR
jgi:hypothetical protein